MVVVILLEPKSWTSPRQPDARRGLESVQESLGISPDGIAFDDQVEVIGHEAIDRNPAVPSFRKRPQFGDKGCDNLLIAEERTAANDADRCRNRYVSPIILCRQPVGLLADRPGFP